MQLSDLKRPRYYLPIGLLLVIAIASAVVFNPGFQKKMLLQHGGPLVDSLQLGYVHITPWSVQLEQLVVDYAGGHFQLQSGSLRFCPSSLLLLRANIKTLELKDLAADLRSFDPPPSEEPEESSLFAGILASLRHGVGYTVQHVDINAEVLLPDEQSLTASVSGGGIDTNTSGRLNTEIQFYTGVADEIIAVDGEFVFDQLSRGRFNEIAMVLDIDASLASLPETESAQVRFVVTPAPFSEAELLSIEAGDEQPQYVPEALQLVIEQRDGEDQQRSKLTLKGRYNGNNGQFEGDYQVVANERLLQRYVQDTEIPPTEEKLSGELLFNIADTTGDVTVISDLLIDQIRETHSNENLPELLRLENNFRLSLLPDLRLRVDTLDSGLVDESATRPLASSLPEDLDIPLQDVESFMHQEQTLLAFSLPEVPLAWFDILLPDQQLTEGTLSASFEINTDTEGAVHLVPLTPLKISGLTLLEADKPVLQGVNLSVLPRASYHGESLHVSLDELRIDDGKSTVMTADLKATAPLGEHAGTLDVRYSADLMLHPLVKMLGLEASGRQTLPKKLSVDFQANVQQTPDVVTINTVESSVMLNNITSLLDFNLLQPLLLDKTATGMRIRNSAGKLATLYINNINLGWFSAFVPEITLKGKLQRTELLLAATEPGVIMLSSSKPARLNGLTVTGADGALLQDVDISVRPTIHHSPDGTRIQYRDFVIRGESKQLLVGHGSVTLPAAEGNALLAEGKLDVDVQALSQQPLLAEALQGTVVSPVHMKADYKLAQDASSIAFDRLSTELFYDDESPRLSLMADSKVRIRTQLGSKQSELGRASGKLTLTVANLTPEPFAEILEANGVAFAVANGETVLSSDGRSLRIKAVEPLTVTGIRIGAADKAVLDSFTLQADTETVMQGDALHVQLKQLMVTFDKHPEKPAIDVTADVKLKGQGADTWVEGLTAQGAVQLPGLLDQPGLLPGHKLTAGEMSFVVALDASGQLESTATVSGLKSNEELPLQLLELQLNGQLNKSGSFDINAPLRTLGKSGESDLNVKAAHVEKQGENNDIIVSVESHVFYLNDILNTLKAISNEQSVQQAEAELSEQQQAAVEAEERADYEQADERAFWDVVPYNRQASYNIQRLFYTDYLEITDITGRAEISSTRLSVDEFKAHFHESPVVLDAVMTFTPGDSPYNLKMQVDVDAFDLATLQRELDPDAVPRAEGLFDVDVEAFGSSPNMPQYRNNLFFDMTLRSRNGVFRLLNPNDPIVVGSSNLVGAVGAGVSYVPTGLFGLGAVARLVNYIKEVPYDAIDVHLVRGDSRDLQIQKYVVQSPEILLVAKGGVSYEENVDILDSPLKLDAQLNLRDEGAAIFYDLDLLQDEEDAFGYWLGPQIKFWGTPGQAESNLGEIIDQAGKGALLGGITRPISGLIGNIRHKWIDNKGAPLEYSDTPPVTAPVDLVEPAPRLTEETDDDLPDWYE